MALKDTTKKFSVLTVDDIPKNLQVLGNILRKENYQVMFASSGEAALSIVETEKPDLILLDIMMPEMDGYEVCERLKSNEATAEIPIIFLTAKTETEDIVRGFEFGAVDYVTKPFNASELLARVRTHLELKESKESLKKLIATNSKFFSIMSHDIRNALIGVKGVSKFLLEDIKTGNKENIAKMATLMHNDAAKLFDLLDNLIEWSNINTGNIENKPQKYELVEMVESVLNVLKDRAEKKNVRITSSVESGIYLFIDLHVLNTILYDVIHNAIKFSQPRGGEVKISAIAKDDAVEIIVIDNGIGMKPQVVKNLFLLDTPHQKTVGTGNEIGSGLGLIISNALVERNNGSISATSTLGEETIVKVTLPRFVQD